MYCSSIAPRHTHPHRRLAPDPGIEGKIRQGIELFDGDGIDLPQDLERHFPDTAHELIAGVCLGSGVLKLAAGIGGNFGANVEVAGLEDIDHVCGKFQVAVVVPAAEQTAENAIGGR